MNQGVNNFAICDKTRVLATPNPSSIMTQSAARPHRGLFWCTLRHAGKDLKRILASDWQISPCKKNFRQWQTNQALISPFKYSNEASSLPVMSGTVGEISNIIQISVRVHTTTLCSRIVLCYFQVPNAFKIKSIWTWACVNQNFYIQVSLGVTFSTVISAQVTVSRQLFYLWKVFTSCHVYFNAWTCCATAASVIFKHFWRCWRGDLVFPQPCQYLPR